MIVRIWHGWTSVDNADAYERLLDEVIVPGIVARDIPGVRHVDILRRCDVVASSEVEFATVMHFDHWAAVESFAGSAATSSVVPPEARRLLDRFDDHSQHYEVVGRHGSAVP